MYINTTLLKEYQLTPANLIALQIISQLRFEEVPQDSLKFATDNLPLDKDKYVTKIKGSSKQTEDEKLRLTHGGKKALENVQIPEITEGDVQLSDHLISTYLAEDDERKTGNRKKIKENVAITRKYLGLSLHQMFYLCETFVSEYEYTKVLEYIFFNPNKHRYGKFINHIDDSPLVIWYHDNIREVELIWKQKIK